jgi:hypothetical protein
MLKRIFGIKGAKGKGNVEGGKCKWIRYVVQGK